MSTSVLYFNFKGDVKFYSAYAKNETFCCDWLNIATTDFSSSFKGALTSRHFLLKTQNVGITQIEKLQN